MELKPEERTERTENHSHSAISEHIRTVVLGAVYSPLI